MGHKQGEARMYQFSQEDQDAVCVDLDGKRPAEHLPRRQPAGFQCILQCTHHAATISSLAIASRLKLLAVADEAGCVSLIDLSRVGGNLGVLPWPRRQPFLHSMHNPMSVFAEVFGQIALVCTSELQCMYQTRVQCAVSSTKIAYPGFCFLSQHPPYSDDAAGPLCCPYLSSVLVV